MPASIRLTEAARGTLEKRFNELTIGLPGCFLSITTNDGSITFQARNGPVDVLNEGSPAVAEDTIIWLSSATRFVVALAYLQLVDDGKISLDEPLSTYSPELEDVAKRILRGFEDQDQPIYEPSNGVITLRTMLNGTSGFGPEFDPAVQKFKALAKTGKGSVNTCCVENLIHTPPTAQPGETYQYGTAPDWLSFIFPSVAGQDLESYLQAKIFEPLGIKSATFYPFDSPLRDHVMPLRWLAGTKDGVNEYEEWTGQQAVHLLPKKKADIQYPVGGAGLYATVTDYVRLLQNVLQGINGSRASDSFSPLFSPKTYRLVLQPDLDASQTIGLSDFMNGYFALSADEGDALIGADEMNVSLGDLPIYTGGRRKAGWGRRGGSGGWGGAACTDFYIDPVTGVAVMFSTQLLPGSTLALKVLKKNIEKAVFEALDSSNSE